MRKSRWDQFFVLLNQTGVLPLSCISHSTWTTGTGNSRVCSKGSSSRAGEQGAGGWGPETWNRLPTPDNSGHLLRLVLPSWLTSGKNYQLPRQCAREELRGLYVKHLIAGIPVMHSSKTIRGSSELCDQRRGTGDLNNLKRTQWRNCPGISTTVVHLWTGGQGSTSEHLLPIRDLGV